MIVISDIDFTICDSSHRTHYLQKDPNDWKGFYTPKEVMKDKPILATRSILRAMDNDNKGIVYVTSRTEAVSELTYKWLRKNHFPLGLIIFRPENDERPSEDVKESALALIKLMYNEPILFALEDKPKCVEMYRRNGVMCLALPEGDYQGN